MSIKYKKGDVVTFKVKGSEFVYLVMPDHLMGRSCSNDAIFNALDVNPEDFCRTYYGYLDSEDGCWPEFRQNDYAAANRVIQALQELCDKEPEEKPYRKYKAGDHVEYGGELTKIAAVDMRPGCGDQAYLIEDKSSYGEEYSYWSEWFDWLPKGTYLTEFHTKLRWVTEDSLSPTTESTDNPTYKMYDKIHVAGWDKLCVFVSDLKIMPGYSTIEVPEAYDGSWSREQDYREDVPKEYRTCLSGQFRNVPSIEIQGKAVSARTMSLPTTFPVIDKPTVLTREMLDRSISSLSREFYKPISADKWYIATVPAPKKSFMSKIYNFAKNLTLTADEKLLRKYGLKDECGEYSDEAEELVIAKLIKDNEDYLIKTAQALEDEEKASKK